MFGVSAVDLMRAGTFGVLADGPLRNVDMVSTPVRELATRVFVPPPKGVVTSLLDVVDFALNSVGSSQEFCEE